MNNRGRLQILIAGCAPDERKHADARVRASLGPRAGSGDWTVSLVKLKTTWSVTLDGPEPHLKGLSFEVSDDRLQVEIRQALDREPSNAPERAAAAPASVAQAKRSRHKCTMCARPFEVHFDTQPGEREVATAVACPRCWHVQRVPVAEGASATESYRAEATPD